MKAERKIEMVAKQVEVFELTVSRKELAMLTALANEGRKLEVKATSRDGRDSGIESALAYLNRNDAHLWRTLHGASGRLDARWYVGELENA